MREIIVSPYWNKTFKVLLVLDAFLVLFASYILICDYTLDGFIIIGGYVLIIVLITVWLLYGVRRLLTKVVVTDFSFESVLLNKKQCHIYRNKKVYYMIFQCSESVYSRKRFILISNRPFKYNIEEKVFSRKIISYYDIKTQILMPYDKLTSNLFDLANWEKVDNQNT